MKRRGVVPILFTLAVVAIAIVVVLDLIYHWTGYSNFTVPLTNDQVAQRQKTLWDWLDLLLIPLVLAGGGLWFSQQERRNERFIAERRAEEAALEAYLGQMTTLLLEKSLRDAIPENPVRDVARAWTLTVLRRVSGERKGVLLRFLQESRLIRIAGERVVSLERADLSGADLRVADLKGADLRGVDLSIADLSIADLSIADLEDADLSGADRRRANLYKADLRYANLKGAKLQYANLQEANLYGAHLEGANLEHADLNYANLYGAHLEGANLQWASLYKANLEEAHLEHAHLSGANLEEAHLEHAHLSGAVYSSKTRRPSDFDFKRAGAKEDLLKSGNDDA